MKVYKFKCKNCGATSYEKVNETTYKCKYCGYREEVIVEQNNKKDERDTEIQELKEAIEELTESQRQAQRQAQLEKSNVAKHALISFLLCLFVGYLGVHRFIEGKIFTGILFLFTFGLFGVGVGIDCLVRLDRLISAIKNNK